MAKRILFCSYFEKSNLLTCSLVRSGAKQKQCLVAFFYYRYCFSWPILKKCYTIFLVCRCQYYWTSLWNCKVIFMRRGVRDNETHQKWIWKDRKWKCKVTIIFFHHCSCPVETWNLNEQEEKTGMEIVTLEIHFISPQATQPVLSQSVTYRTPNLWVCTVCRQSLNTCTVVLVN